MTKIAPSILTADFSNLQKELESIRNADYIHLDVMDGHFVPNLTFGPNVIKDLRKHTTIPFDVHLMIEHPEKYIPKFADAGADIITVHIEAASDILKTIELIKSYNILVGVSIKPNTPVDAIKEILPLLDLVLVMSVEPGFGGQKFMPIALEKISDLASLKQVNGYHYLIEVDGGINEDTAGLCKEVGVEILVAGSYIFNQDDRQAVITNLQK